MTTENVLTMTVQEWIEKLTLIEVCAVLRVTPQTIRNWRTSLDFPTIELDTGHPTPEVRYDYDTVAAWAKHHGKPLFMTYEEVMERRKTGNHITHQFLRQGGAFKKRTKKKTPPKQAMKQASRPTVRRKLKRVALAVS